MYYIRHCLHDYSDQKARCILRQISNAMAADSTLLIAERVVEWPPNAESTSMDMLMLAVGGKERTAREWADLLGGVGLALERIHRVPTSSNCVLQCGKATAAVDQDRTAAEA